MARLNEDTALGCITQPPPLAIINKLIDRLDATLREGMAHARLQRSQQAALDHLAELDALAPRIAEALHIDYSQLLSKRRDQHTATCRQISIFLSRKLTGAS